MKGIRRSLLKYTKKQIICPVMCAPYDVSFAGGESAERAYNDAEIIEIVFLILAVALLLLLISLHCGKSCIQHAYGSFPPNNYYTME